MKLSCLNPPSSPSEIPVHEVQFNPLFAERTDLRTNNFDPLKYIENAFLDTPEHEAGPNGNGNGSNGNLLEKPKRFRKTVMSAPRPRRAKAQGAASEETIDPNLQSVWTALPKNVEFLCRFYDDNVTANYYRGEFKETRQELIRRLLDPELSLEETARLLGVCPATVRRYTNRGWLEHHRTIGGQRRFRLSDLVKFIELHGRFPEEA